MAGRKLDVGERGWSRSVAVAEATLRSCFIYLRPVASSAQVEFHSWNLNKGGQGFSPPNLDSLLLSRRPPPKPDLPSLPLPPNTSKNQTKIIKRKFRHDQMSTAVALFLADSSPLSISNYLSRRNLKKKASVNDEFSPTFILVEIDRTRLTLSCVCV